MAWDSAADTLKSDIGVEGFLRLLAKLRRNFIHQLSRQAALTVEQMFSRLDGRGGSAGGKAAPPPPAHIGERISMIA